MNYDIQLSEKYIISCALQDKQSFFLAKSKGITIAHFPSLSATWSQLEACAARHNDTSIECLLTHFPETNIQLVSSLVQAAPTSAFLTSHVNFALDERKRQDCYHSIAQALECVKSGKKGEWAKTWTEAYQNISKAINSADSTTERSLQEMADSYCERRANPKLLKTISTGMPLIDEKFGKPAAGELITIAARPGQGKSALGIMLAYAAAHYGHRTLIFSAEMSGEEIIDRIICIVGGKDAKYNDHKAIAEAKILGKLKNLHIFDDQSTHSISKIDAKARAMASLEGGIGCIMIDYLGLIEPEDKRQVREQQIANMTKALKRLASYCKCPIYLLCQLNRNVEANGKPRDPILSDLRESGAIEQDSNRVWFLCEDQEWLEQLPAGHLPAAIQNKWIQAKYRGGQANIGQKMLFDKPIFKLLPVIS